MIYQKNMTAAQSVLSHFQNGSHLVLLCSKPQNGKTATISELAYQFTYGSFGLNNGVAFDAGISSRHLLEQQTERIKNYRKKKGGWNFNQRSGPLKDKLIGIFHLPNSNSKKGKKACVPETVEAVKKAFDGGCEKILIIRDECDFGSADESNFATFLKQVDFKNDDRLYMCIVTATPGPILDASKRENIELKIVYLPTDNGYYGLSDHLKKGKVNETYCPTKDSDRFEDDLKDYKKNFNGAAYVLRFTKKDKDFIRQAALGAGIGIQEYSYHDDNIKHFAEDLKTPFEAPALLVIDKSYSAGITLEDSCNNNIYRWHDAPFAKNDRASVQSAARPFGYKTPFDFEMLMDLDSLCEWMQMNDNFESGNYKEAINNTNMMQGEIMKRKRNQNSYVYEFQGVFPSVREMKKYFENKHINSNIHYPYRTSWTSQNISKAVNSWVNSGAEQMNRADQISLPGLHGTSEKHSYCSLVVNKHSGNPKHSSDWDKIPSEYHGKVILFRRIKQTKDVMENNSLYNSKGVLI